MLLRQPVPTAAPWPVPPPALWQPLQAMLGAMPAQPVAVAFSGGPDSLALAATLAWVLAQPGAAALHAELWHVHHGLLAEADQWAAQAAQWASVLQRPLRVQRVQVAVQVQHEHGLEAAARQARQQAFQHLARQSGVAALLLAQHQDDQAETVLFRLLRGAGPGGLAAMRAQARLGAITVLRPWLNVPRSVILPFAQSVAQAAGVALAQDPSNHDVRHARGWLRQQVMPALAGYWPGYRRTLARHAQQTAELQDWLDDLVAEDLTRLRLGAEALNLAAWRKLPASRARLVLRAWLQSLGLGLPTAARLLELERQLQQAGPDRQLRWLHDGAAFGVYRNQLQRLPSASWRPPADFERAWQHEPAWVLPDGRGVLRFERAAYGVCPQWLAGRVLRVSWQEEGGRLRLAEGQPSRPLKAWFQQHAVAPWWRERAVRVWSGSTLLFVAGLGSSVNVPCASPGIRLLWGQASPPDDKPAENAG